MLPVLVHTKPLLSSATGLHQQPQVLPVLARGRVPFSNLCARCAISMDMPAVTHTPGLT